MTGGKDEGERGVGGGPTPTPLRVGIAFDIVKIVVGGLGEQEIGRVLRIVGINRPPVGVHANVVPNSFKCPVVADDSFVIITLPEFSLAVKRMFVNPSKVGVGYQ